MATEKDFELLDDYIANRLDGAQRASFEQKLMADPDLKNEFTLQQSLIENIRRSRARELKSMLQNIPVPAGTQAGGMSAGAKALLATVVTALVVTGIYLYFKQEPPPAGITPSEAVPAPEIRKDPEPVIREEAEDQTKDTNTDVSPAPVTRNTDGVARQSPVTQPSIDVYDPSEETAATQDVTIPADESPRTSASYGGSTIAVEIDKHHRHYSFHYQFRDGKLFLYGPFEQNLYEILEFISEDKTTIFLFYKEGYYLLKEVDDKIRPLVIITEPALLNKLKEYRKN